MIARLHYQLSGPQGAPVLVFGPSLGTELTLFDPQLDAFSQDYRVVRFDLRGHGRSEVPKGPYTVGDLGEDVVALLAELKIRDFSYVGVSIGGAIGLWLALNLGHRLHGLVICASAARFGDPQGWSERASRVRADGTGFLEPSRYGTWFTKAFAHSRPDRAQRLIEMLRRTPPEGYAGCCEAIGSFDVRDQLHEITVPTLVLAGEADPATPVEMCRDIVDGIPDARLVVIPEAAHLLTVEQPEIVNAAIAGQLRNDRNRDRITRAQA
jgi:3-oxoadipate enol-lactonase